MGHRKREYVPLIDLFFDACYLWSITNVSFHSEGLSREMPRLCLCWIWKFTRLCGRYRGRWQDSVSLIFPSSSNFYRLYGRTIRLEPATGGRKRAGEFRDHDRDRRPQNPQGYREFSTLRPFVAGAMIPSRRPAQLNQVNALVGRRMFGLAASLLTRRRFMWDISLNLTPTGLCKPKEFKSIGGANVSRREKGTRC